MLSLLLGALSLAAAALFALLLYLRRKHSRSPFPGLPSPPDPQWLVGHVEDRTVGLDASLKQICADHANASGVTAMWYFGTPTVTVLRSEDARVILQSTPARMNMPGFVKRQLEMITGRKNILLLEGKEWKFHRQAIMRALNKDTMDKAKGVAVDMSLKLCDSLAKAGKQQQQTITIELLPTMQMLTLDIFGAAAFSFAFNNCLNMRRHPVADAIQVLKDEYERRMNSPVLGYFFNTPTEKNREHARARKKVRDFIEGIVEERMAKANREGELGDDVLGHLLRARAREDLKEKDGRKREQDQLVEETMADVILTLIFAGQDTTSLALTYALLEVARNPGVERLCLEEIDKVWTETDQTSVPDPSDLAYCAAVIQEALRLFPPLPGMVRTLTKPVTVGTKGVDACEIPVGTYTYMPFWLIQRDGRNYERPLEFLPERWAERDGVGPWRERSGGTKENKRTDADAGSAEEKKDGDDRNDAQEAAEVAPGNRDAFFSFSAGGRSCVGERLARLELALVFATLLRRLRFEWEDGYELEVMHASTGQRPSDGVPVRVSRR